MLTHDDGFAGSLTPGRRPVVLAIDMMKAYFRTDSHFCLPSRNCLISAARVINAARNVGIPVIHTRVEFTDNGLDGGVFIRKIPALRALAGGGELAALMPEVSPLDEELVITKQYASAFFGTTLASTLNALEADTVVITGVTTSGCIRATAVDACQMGLIPIVVRDAVGDRSSEPHNANLFDLKAKYAEIFDEVAAIAYVEREGTA